MTMIKTLMLLCSILLLIMIGEWLYALNAQTQLLASLSPKSTVKPVYEIARIDLDKRSEIDYKDLVDRPLFIQGRRAIPEKDAQQSNKPSNFNWSLSGIYSSKNSWKALLVKHSAEPAINETTAKLANNKYRRVAEDTEIDGWYVNAIYADSIRLTRGNTEIELLLRKEKSTQVQNPLPLFGSARSLHHRKRRH